MQDVYFKVSLGNPLEATGVTLDELDSFLQGVEDKFILSTDYVEGDLHLERTKLTNLVNYVKEGKSANQYILKDQYHTQLGTLDVLIVTTSKVYF